MVFEILFPVLVVTPDFSKKDDTSEKIAEFNSDHSLFRALGTEEKIRKIAELRNERIETTKRIFGLE